MVGSWVISLFVASGAVLYANVPGVGAAAMTSFAFLVIPAVGLPFLLRFGVRFEVLSVALVVTIQAALTFSAFVDRGLHDVALLWMIVTPLYGGFVAGPRTGAVIAGTAAAAGVCVLVGTEAGYEFPMLMGEVAANRYFVANLAAAVSLVAVLAWAYEGPISAHLHELSESLRETNEELRHELERRRDAQHAAEAASRAKDALLANMSHEFRTPLTAILSGAEALDLEASDEDRLVLDAMRRGAHRLLATLDGVLDLSRLEDGAALERAPVDVGDVVRSVAGRYRCAASAKGLEVQVVAPRVHVLADRAALERVVAALTDNAVRFTERGHVGVGAALEDGAVRVVVADTGVGMAPEFVGEASEPFLQASEGHGRTHEGLGLGLTLARRLSEAMGGRLEIESEPGYGTTVTVTLPALEAGPPPPRASGRPRGRVPGGTAV